MSYILNSGNNHLFVSDFEIVEEIIASKKVYRLKDWFQIANGSGVPISYINGYDDINLESNKGIKLGGVNSNNSDQTDNKTFLISSNYFKYNSNKVYKITVRLKKAFMNDTVFVGFIGYTARPNVIRTYDSNSYFNECKNLSNMIMGDGNIIPATFTDSVVMKHFTPIYKHVVANEDFYDFIGYVSGSTLNTINYTSTTGLDIDNTVPVNQSIEYFSPFIYVNSYSYDKTDNFSIVIDYIHIDDEIILSYENSEFVLSSESTPNLSSYEPDTLYIINDEYVDAGY